MGGAEAYLRSCARGLTHFGTVDVLTSDLNLPARTRSGVVLDSKFGLTVHYLPSFPVAGEKFILPLGLLRALLRSHPRLVWTSHPSLSADVAGLFALLSGKVWIACYMADLSPPNWYRRALMWLEGLLLRRADCVEVTSYKYQERLAARGVQRSRLVKVLLPLGIGNGTPPVAEDATRVSNLRAERALLFVGGLDRQHDYKRLDTVLRAISSLRASKFYVKLWIVGDGDRKNLFVSMASQLGLDKLATFLGRVSDGELAARYAAARALIVPSDSDSEGFGIVTIEAISYACPVIISSVVPSSELVADNGCGLLYNPFAPDELADQIRRLWSDEHLYDSLVAGCERVSSELRSSDLSAGLVQEPLKRTSLWPDAVADSGAV